MVSRLLRRRPDRPTALVWLLIAFYVILFSLNSVQIHRALQTHTADLGQIDLAVWNTSRGRFVQEIKGETLSTRLTDHVEPIWIPISLIYWVWNDVRALLVLQTIALAAGAWPLYLLARRRVLASDHRFLQERWQHEQHQHRLQGIATKISQPPGASAGWGPALLALIYLLYPALQAANLTEVHAIPFATPLIGFALWYIESGQWGRFAAAALLLAAVKEEAALLAALLALYGLWRAWRSRPRPHGQEEDAGSRATRGMALAAGVAAISLLWFVLATFVIVPAHAAEVYDAAESTYFQRYGSLGDNAGDILRSLVTRPAEVWAIASTPGRVRYLVGLLLATGALGLFGPKFLLLSAPLLLANLLSSFEAQWSGEFHYSAPLAAYFMAAAAAGLNALARRLSWSTQLRPAQLGNRLALAGLLIALVYHSWAGWTPLGRNFRWPEVTPHARLLGQFLTQIPRQAPVAATTALAPHLSHRQFIYTLPNLGQAQWVLADVSGTTDMHPAALQELLLGLIDQGWGVVDAEDGYLLLAAQGGARAIPDRFYDFARVDPATARLDQTVEAVWPGGTTYLGYAIQDQPRWGLTRLTHYVRAGETPLSPYFFIAAADGAVVDDSSLRPPAALQWYPPTRWQPGEVIALGSAWFLPDLWRPGVAFALAGDRPLPSPAADPNHRLPLPAAAVDSEWELLDNTLWLQPWRRPYTRAPLQALADRPAANLRRITIPPAPVLLWLQTPPRDAEAGQEVSLRLGWFLDAPLQQEYTVFLHLLDADGNRVAQADGPPHHFHALPTPRWPVRAGLYTGHRLALPADLPPGAYQLSAGLYDLATLDRLLVAAPQGRPGGEVQVGILHVRRGDGDITRLGR